MLGDLDPNESFTSARVYRGSRSVEFSGASPIVALAALDESVDERPPSGG